MKIDWRAAGLLLPLAAAAVMIYGWPIAPDNDLYFHLAAGREGGPLISDVFTYTEAGKPDEAWHSWGSQRLLWEVYEHFGFTGLKVLNVFLLWLILTMVARFTWEKTRDWGAATLAATLALLVHHHVQILRPMLFGEVFFVAFALNLRRWPWAVALPLGILWANFHASVVLLPLLYCLAGRNPVPAIFAAAVNPRGFGLYTYAWDLTRLGKLAGNWEWGGVQPLEWSAIFGQSPLLRAHLDVPVLLMIASLLTALWCFRKKEYAVATTLIAVSTLPLISMRHVVYLIFSAAILPAIWWKRAGFAGVVVSLALLASFRFHRSFDVIASIDKMNSFLSQVGVEGNVFCEPAWANAVLFSQYPRMKVARDTRTMLHQEFYARSSRLYDELGPAAWNVLIEEAPSETDWLFVSSWRPTLPFSDKEWLVVFENNHVTVALRRGARNENNLNRIAAYYDAVKVPFDRTHGFSSAAAASSAPHWFAEAQEVMPWGKWPEPAARAMWERRQKAFYESRKITGLRPLG